MVLKDNPKYLACDYFLETTDEPKKVAAAFCEELSTAQWQRPNVDEDLRPRFGAKLIELNVLNTSDQPLHKLPTINASRFWRCHVKIAYPTVHFEDTLPALLSALAGEGAFYCPAISALRLKNIHFPNELLAKFPGPRFGLEGLRDKLKVRDRPFFIGVVKPNLGLSPQDFAAIAGAAWLGGLDIAKDDEMLTNPAYSPLFHRIKLCSRLARDSYEKTKKPAMMVANITDEVQNLRLRYNEAVTAGAGAVMVNTYFTGASAIRWVRKFSSVPVWGHFTGMAIYDRIPGHGIDGKVFVKLQRLAGCDVIVLPGFGARMHTTHEAVLENIRACLEPLGPIKRSLPVPGGSDWAGSLPLLYEKIGHKDFGLIAGRGVFAHPDGPQAGAKSLHDAWRAIQEGIPTDQWTGVSPALRRALEAFGGTNP